MNENAAGNKINANAARILQAAIKALRAEILPQLNDETRIRFDQIIRLLNDVSARLSRREDGLRELVQSAAEYLQADIPATHELSAAQLESQRQKLEREISGLLPDLVSDVGKQGDALKKLEEMVNLEKAFFLSQDPDIAEGSQVVYRGGRIEKEPGIESKGGYPAINELTLTAYLQQKFPEADSQAINVRTIPGGFSKHTVFFTRKFSADGSMIDLVIRKDMPVPFIEKTVADEFGLLRALHSKGFPVARPLWFEEDKTLFGGCFIVSERVAGTSDVVSWSADPLQARNACEELARVLACLHSFKPEELERPEHLARLSAGQLMEREIDKWTQLFESRKSEPLPLQQFPLTWLRENIPVALFERPARVVHGDVGFHNLMVDDPGKITALLDWEFSVLGDPTQDLCFVRGFVEGLMSWQDFMAIYLSTGGAPPCEEAEFFFNLWSKVRNSIGCVDAQAIFDNVMPDEIKFALAGHVFAPYLYIDECESLINYLKQNQ